MYYSEAILIAQQKLLKKDKNVYIIGQGVRSPWYVGNTMNGLFEKFGENRIIDSPVSESAVTGSAIGSSIFKKKPIVVHPRMDFMMYALDSIINHASKWKYIFSGKSNINVTIRSIINRGGEQGAQHSQALHSIFANIPGLHVVMPYSVSDAYNLLISSVNSSTPVIFIEDRWLYSSKETLKKKNEKLEQIQPKLVTHGKDITIVAFGFGTSLAVDSSKELKKKYKIDVEVIDLRILNPIKVKKILRSVNKTKRLLTIDIGWGPCGVGSEIISEVVQKIGLNKLACSPKKISLPFSPAPTSSFLEKKYYFDKKEIVSKVLRMIKNVK